jgi:hypothetical protein
MAYDLSFSAGFFWDNADYPEITSKPCSVYESLYNMYLSDRDNFNDMVKEVLSFDFVGLDYLPETLIHELVDKVKEYSTCCNINTPVEVYINENYTVKVY